MENYAKNNFENAFEMRHESRKCWGLPDEVAEKALEIFEEFGLDYEHNDAIVMYDNLAINADIVEKENLNEHFGSVENADYMMECLAFESENYYVFNY